MDISKVVIHKKWKTVKLEISFEELKQIWFPIADYFPEDEYNSVPLYSQLEQILYKIEGFDKLVGKKHGR